MVDDPWKTMPQEMKHLPHSRSGSPLPADQPTDWASATGGLSPATVARLRGEPVVPIRNLASPMSGLQQPDHGVGTLCDGSPDSSASLDRGTTAQRSSSLEPILRELLLQQQEGMRSLMREMLQLQHRTGDCNGSPGTPLSQRTASTSSSGSGAPVSKPPAFGGDRPREWLLQMEWYYEDLGWTESKRLRDVVQHLKGEALSHWCTFVETGLPLPNTWEELRQCILERFACKSEGQVLRELRATRWDGSLDSLSARFARALSEGAPPPADLVARIFVSRVPYPIMEKVGRASFASWTEAREAVRRVLAPREMLRELWLSEAPGTEKRDYIDQKRDNRQQVPSGRGAPERYAAQRDRGLHRPQVSGTLGGRAETQLRCHMCNGIGHRAKDCPNQHQSNLKAGQTCVNCRGVGHWANSCTSTKRTTSTAGRPEGAREEGQQQPQRGNGTA